MSSIEPPDVIDRLAGIAPGSALDRIRTQRPQARANAQASYRALFAPAAPGSVGLDERFAVATFVAHLHSQPDIVAFYRARLLELADQALANVVEREAAAGAAEGPYGAYPPGPLSPENSDGPILRLSAESRSRLGPRLSAAFEHAHMLVFHPRDADPGDLQALLEAGFSVTDIVTLSQLVAFLAFQIRVIEGLHILGAAAEGEPA